MTASAATAAHAPRMRSWVAVPVAESPSVSMKKAKRKTLGIEPKKVARR
jgi:hypothetical protein